MEPARTCLGCRSRDDRSTLLRVVAREGQVVPDSSASLPGRGAWVHPTVSCVEAAVKRRAFGRALRSGSGLGADAVLAHVAHTVEQAERTMDN